MEEVVDGVVDVSKSYLDEDLRLIATYESEGYEVEYLRDDLDSEFSEQQLDLVHEALIVRDIGRDYLETIVDSGVLKWSIYHFAKSRVYHVPLTVSSGFYISVEPESFEQETEWVRSIRDSLD